MIDLPLSWPLTTFSLYSGISVLTFFLRLFSLTKFSVLFDLTVKTCLIHVLVLFFVLELFDF